MTKNHVFYTWTKCIEVHHHFICEYVQNGEIDLMYQPMKDQVADIFTKALSKPKFESFQHDLDVKFNEVVIKGGC